MRQKSGQSEKGFTLIEVMIISVIIGILAALVVPRLFDLGGPEFSIAQAKNAMFEYAYQHLHQVERAEDMTITCGTEADDYGMVVCRASHKKPCSSRTLRRGAWLWLVQRRNASQHRNLVYYSSVEKGLSRMEAFFMCGFLCPLAELRRLCENF